MLDYFKKIDKKTLEAILHTFVVFVVIAVTAVLCVAFAKHQAKLIEQQATQAKNAAVSCIDPVKNTQGKIIGCWDGR